MSKAFCGCLTAREPSHRMDVAARINGGQITKVLFARRQSPDWEMISRHYRNGDTVDPSWFVPQEDLPGFPTDIVELIGNWNKAFSIDFFTFRARVAKKSRANISAIPASLSFSYDDPALLEAMTALPAALVYFHDDDDFFSPRIAEAVVGIEAQCDALVSPLFRIGSGTSTFVKPEVGSDYIWGAKGAFHMLFQSNNYGLRAGFFSNPADILEFKDHVMASAAAIRLGLNVCDIATPLSATVKTPASASMLKTIVGPRAMVLRRLGLSGLRTDYFQKLLDSSKMDGVPDEYDWVKEPLEDIRTMVSCILAKRPFDLYS